MRIARCLWVVILLLGGCAVGPNYRRTSVALPESFRGADHTSGTNSLGDLPWWQVFRDPDLQQLISTALTNNYDIRIAVARVEQARAILEQNRGLFLPQLNYGFNVSRGRNSTAGQPVATGGSTVDSYSLAGNAAWEIDLWGRIRRLNESARAELLATAAAREGVRITLVSEVANTYFQLLAFDRLLDVARQTTNSFGESLRIFNQRLQGGIVSKLESSAAEALLASASATVPDLERQLAITENQLSVLLGTNPGPILRNRQAFTQTLPVDVPAGLPSELLRRRPDIIEAEQGLRSANAQVGAAVADFFPRLSLTGLFGQVSPELSALTAGSANAWSVGAGLAGPLFHGGQLIGRYRQQKALRQEAELRYRYSILAGLQDVSNALISREKFAQARIEQVRAVEANRTAVQVATERYVAGKAGYYELLQQQQQLFPAMNALVQVELNQSLSAIQLYRALGGGWSVNEESR